MNASALSVSLSLAECLSDLALVVASTNDAVYRATRDDGVSGSIGAHVRHTIDHVAALVDGSADGSVDYDSRRRGTEVERSRAAARSELERLAHKLCWLSEDDMQSALEVNAVVHVSGRRLRALSTVARELVFVLSHTIHHQAIIALLLASTGRRTPERFGLAPSTPGFASCARSA
jgi:uncharacterized damage-inducible protein DinB